MKTAEAPESRREGGSVLVLVLLLMGVVVALAVYGLRMAQVESTGAKLAEQDMQARELGKSGVRLAELLLLRDLRQDREREERADHPGEAWGSFPGGGEAALPQPETGELEGEIVDEQGKLPVNALLNEEGNWSSAHRGILENLLLGHFELSGPEAETVLFSLKDWMDADQEPSGTRGAESAYYRRRDRPWTCRDGPLRSLAELRLVRGVSRELYSGSEDTPGLKDLITVHGQGEININTAVKPVLAALIKQQGNGLAWSEAVDFAEDMIRYRRDRMHWDQLGQKQWWTNVSGALSVQMHPVTATTSSVFSVRVTAETGTSTAGSHAVLRRKTSSSGDGDSSPSLERIRYEME